MEGFFCVFDGTPRDVETADILGREPVELDIQPISKVVTGETVNVTGAGACVDKLN